MNEVLRNKGSIPSNLLDCVNQELIKSEFYFTGKHLVCAKTDLQETFL